MDSEQNERKYNEYKQKLVAWARLFEDEYGYPPTEDDRVESNTWNALNEKARFYKKLLYVKDSASTAQRPDQSSSPTKRHQSRRVRGGDREGDRERGHSTEAYRREGSRRGDDRDNSAPMARPGSRGRRRDDEGWGSSPHAERDGRSMGRSARGSSKSFRRGVVSSRAANGGSFKEREHGSPDRGRSTTSRRARRERSEGRGESRGESRGSDGRGESGHGGSPWARRDGSPRDEALPPLPTVPSELQSRMDYATIASRASEAMEKLRKWERAFEREQGEPPSPANKAESGTYNNYRRKYRGYVAQLQELADEFVPSADADADADDADDANKHRQTPTNTDNAEH